jgi:hypothetical protein
MLFAPAKRLAIRANVRKEDIGSPVGNREGKTTELRALQSMSSMSLLSPSQFREEGAADSFVLTEEFVCGVLYRPWEMMTPYILLMHFVFQMRKFYERK